MSRPGGRDCFLTAYQTCPRANLWRSTAEKAGERSRWRAKPESRYLSTRTRSGRSCSTPRLVRDARCRSSRPFVRATAACWTASWKPRRSARASDARRRCASWRGPRMPPRANSITGAAANAAYAASHAAAAAFLHPIATPHQVKHVLGAAVHQAVALELEAGSDRNVGCEQLRWAAGLASPVVRQVLRRLPPPHRARGRFGELLGELDAGLRG